VMENQPLPEGPDALATRLQRWYRNQGYAAAVVEASFDESTRTLKVTIREGRVDEILFQGIRQQHAERFASEFAIQPGDVYNTREVRTAVDALLAVSRGAIVTGAVAPAYDEPSPEKDGRWRPPFALVDIEGRNVLVVALRERSGAGGWLFGTDGREDSFSPVDGLNAAVGFQATAFDHSSFNNVYVRGFVSYKFSRETSGYSAGLERPFLPSGRLFLGAEIHDLTASDDHWRLSPVEQSLMAVGFKETFKDYYRRRGYQVHAAVLLHPAHEAVVQWRDERHQALDNETGFSLFRRDTEYRANEPAAGGRLRAVLFGYAWESRGFQVRSPGDAYQRHLLERLHGSPRPRVPGWRAEWSSEVAVPGWGGDFEFSRHILNIRRYERLSPRQDLNGRLIVGWSGGTLPPQREFAVGGVGSVRGHTFKESSGEALTVANFEYLFGSNLRGVFFFDAGRVFRPLRGSHDGWLTAAGAGVELRNSIRLEAAWPLGGASRSLHLYVRLQPPF
jgi:hypothetical protein